MQIQTNLPALFRGRRAYPRKITEAQTMYRAHPDVFGPIIGDIHALAEEVGRGPIYATYEWNAAARRYDMSLSTFYYETPDDDDIRDIDTKLYAPLRARLFAHGSARAVAEGAAQGSGSEATATYTYRIEPIVIRTHPGSMAGTPGLTDPAFFYFLDNQDGESDDLKVVQFFMNFLNCKNCKNRVYFRAVYSITRTLG